MIKCTKYRIIEYVGGYKEYPTKCPFGQLNRYAGGIKRVGRGDCIRCNYFERIDERDRAVYCSFNPKKQ